MMDWRIVRLNLDDLQSNYPVTNAPIQLPGYQCPNPITRLPMPQSNYPITNAPIQLPDYQCPNLITRLPMPQSNYQIIQLPDTAEVYVSFPTRVHGLRSRGSGCGDARRNRCVSVRRTPFRY